MNNWIYPSELVALVKKLPFMEPASLGWCTFRRITLEHENGTREFRSEIEDAPDEICAFGQDFLYWYPEEVMSLLPLIRLVGQNQMRREIYYFVRKSSWRVFWVRAKFWLGFYWHEFEWRFLFPLGIWGLAEHEPGARVGWADVKWPWKWFRRNK